MTRSLGRSIALVAILAMAGAQGAIACQAAAAPRPLAASPATRYHQLPPAFAGFNAPFRLNSWQARSPELHQAVGGLDPGALRVFGGTTANYWNWRTGRFFDRPGVPPRLRRVSRGMSPIHLPDWAGLVRDAHAIPIFDLNLVTSTLSDQLAMLRRAERLGMPIRRIELGNELYYSAPLVVRSIPSPKAYGRKATRWIDAIRADFPGAQIAAVGFGYGRSGTDKRQDHWDRGVRKTLRGESALTFHAYWQAPRTRRLSGERLAAALAAPLRLLARLRARGLKRLPKGVEAWVTEWNVWHGAKLRGTWANGLADAAYLLGLLAEPSVRQEDLHPLVHSQPHAALFGNPAGFGDGPPTVRYAPTAVGEALRQLYPALSGGVQVRRLRMRQAPELDGTRFAAVRGVVVDGRGALLVNLTGRGRSVRLTGGLSCAGTLSSVWARPSARITGRPGKLRRRSGQTHGTLVLPRHSVSRLSCGAG
jgi:hypothetical protein